jgi:hypothetical protein
VNKKERGEGEEEKEGRKGGDEVPMTGSEKVVGVVIPTGGGNVLIP